MYLISLASYSTVVMLTDINVNPVKNGGEGLLNLTTVVDSVTLTTVPS